MRHAVNSPADILGRRPAATALGASSAKARRTFGRAMKRGFDIAFASSALLLLLPTFVIIAMLIKMSDGGQVLFRHPRVGRYGRSFFCLKFRTMVRDADHALQRHLETSPEAAREWEETRKLRWDPRVTALGAILRKSSLDEMPQLINIVRGDMSVVGPRPIVVEEMPRYGDDFEYYLKVRPGLTGAWQVSGRNDVSYDTRVALDRQYVQQWSFRKDLMIVLKTVPAVFKAKGTY